MLTVEMCGEQTYSAASLHRLVNEIRNEGGITTILVISHICLARNIRSAWTLFPASTPTRWSGIHFCMYERTEDFTKSCV